MHSLYSPRRTYFVPTVPILYPQYLFCCCSHTVSPVSQRSMQHSSYHLNIPSLLCFQPDDVLHVSTLHTSRYSLLVGAKPKFIAIINFKLNYNGLTNRSPLGRPVCDNFFNRNIESMQQGSEKSMNKRSSISQRSLEDSRERRCFPADPILQGVVAEGRVGAKFFAPG